MSFPIPLHAGFAPLGAGIWEVVASGTGANYPSGLQTGDVALLACVRESTAGAGITAPTSATLINTAASTVNVNGKGGINYTNTASLFWRALAAAQSGTAIGGTYDAVSWVVLRPVPAGSAAVLTEIGAQTVNTSINAARDFSALTPPVLRGLSVAAVNATTRTTPAAHTGTIDGEACTVYTATSAAARASILLDFVSFAADSVTCVVPQVQTGNTQAFGVTS